MLEFSTRITVGVIASNHLLFGWLAVIQSFGDRFCPFILVEAHTKGQFIALTFTRVSCSSSEL